MSWLVSSIANSLKLDDVGDDSDIRTTNAEDIQKSRAQNPNADVDEDDSPTGQTTTPRGVKEDLSELSKTLTRQLWGVASFLAPPPQISDRDRDHRVDDPDPNSDDPAGIVGIRNDLSEIGGRFRTGISKLSSNKAVSEFTKMASNLLHFGLEEGSSVEEYARRGVVGVTDEVVAFARDIALHPETWLDFPLPDDHDEEDFYLSDAQQEHALAVERLAPELAALRTELCLGYMSESCFWKIYFVLVHPRLSRHDAEILSTSEIVKDRAMLTQELHRRGESKPYEAGSGNVSADTTKLSDEEHLSVPIMDESNSVPVEILADEPPSYLEIDKHPVSSTEVPVNDESVSEEVPMEQTSREEEPSPSTSKITDEKDEDDVDDWLEEETTDAGPHGGTSYPLGNDDDVSFSDLEEEDEVWIQKGK